MLDSINQGKDMKRIVMVFALLSACASEQPMNADTGAAGSVGVTEENILLAPCDDYQWQSRVKNSLNSAYGCSSSQWTGNGTSTIKNDHCTVGGQLTSLRVGNATNLAVNGGPSDICRTTTFRAKITNGVTGTYCDWLYNHCIIEPWSTGCSAVMIRNSCPPHW